MEATPATDIAVVRRTLRRLTVAVAAVVLVSIPLLFVFAGMRALHGHAALEATVMAERLAAHAAAIGSGALGVDRAVDTEVRLALKQRRSDGLVIERSLLDSSGRLLIAPQGAIAQPVLRVGAPVRHNGRQVATVQAATSLRPLLAETAMVVLFAALVAAGLHLVIDRIALRALSNALDHLQATARERDRALREASEALAQLARQNARLKAASDELARTRDAALSADRSKSMFLAAMSHELRTPLNAIIGFSEVMARELYGPIGHDKYRGYAVDIRTSGDHLLALIDDVLDLSRVEAGKLVLRLEPLDVAEQVEACCHLIEGRAAGSGVQLEFARPPDDDGGVILGDRVRFRQIVLNLLTNAVKFTNRGGRVRVEIDASAPQGVLIRIADTGVGMSASDLDRVFQPFEQVDVGSSRPSEGAGLGLALSRGLVREHQGTLHIASAPSLGTTVTLTFPRLQDRPAVGQKLALSLGHALGDALRDTVPGAS